MARRVTLSPERIVEAAVRVADVRGIAGVSMRNVAAELDVEAMSLYHHIADKESLLNALADWAFIQIDAPITTQPWRSEMEQRARSARQVLGSHPWALGLLSSRRSPGLALMHHHEAVLACLRASGFSLRLALHAFSVLDAYVFGFVLTEVNLPFEGAEDAATMGNELVEVLAPDAFPNMLEVIQTRVMGGSYDYGDEFEVGLRLILDGLARAKRADK
jgi:AcrR family transcriptional regulator